MTENLTGILSVAPELATLSLGVGQTLKLDASKRTGNQLLVDLTQLTVWAHSLVL